MSSAATKATEFISLTGVSKSYGKTVALSGLDLAIRSGEVLGFVGANGAGKSTMLKIVAGTVPASSGQMVLDGREIDFSHYDARRAQERGIYCVYQELSLCNNLSVVENFEVFKSHSAGRSRSQVADAAAHALAVVFPEPGFGPRADVSELPHAQRQMVEIARTAAQPDLRLLILDEPTSALPAARARQLHTYLESCKQRGIGVIYVTHKLSEVLSVSDRVVVLRSGRKELDTAADLVSSDDLVRYLGGGSTSGTAHRSSPSSAVAPQRGALRDVERTSAPVLEVEDIKTVPGAQRQVGPLIVRPGEVVGLAGLEGAGQRRLLRRIFAVARSRSGKGVVVRVPVAYVSGDRKREGVFPLWTIADNLVVSGLSFVADGGVVRPKKVNEVVRRWFNDLGIVARSPDAVISELSGGNQQKVVIARGLVSGAALLLLDDPTRGVDLETKSGVYVLLDTLRAEGRSALFYSTEDDEFEFCDRVYVLANGLVATELVGPDEITSENIITWSYRGLEMLAEAASTGRPAE